MTVAAVPCDRKERATVQPANGPAPGVSPQVVSGPAAAGLNPVPSGKVKRTWFQTLRLCDPTGNKDSST